MNYRKYVGKIKRKKEGVIMFKIITLILLVLAIVLTWHAYKFLGKYPTKFVEGYQIFMLTIVIDMFVFLLLASAWL